MSPTSTPDLFSPKGWCFFSFSLLNFNLYSKNKIDSDTLQKVTLDLKLIVMATHHVRKNSGKELLIDGNAAIKATVTSGFTGTKETNTYICIYKTKCARGFENMHVRDRNNAKGWPLIKYKSSAVFKRIFKSSIALVHVHTVIRHILRTIHW